ncbi:MAG TPA: amidohydrolase [Pararhizobium sp.]|uniref:M20 metallopeptidase family protein n=1 Tax=Pararhizobium sp. TaxID=1977563 RepID=UPI002B79272B|nr:amidohydrolase [Pararhizobium sp.]HTO31519.1 amidohydrolase [Pararhizobium sp.]
MGKTLEFLAPQIGRFVELRRRLHGVPELSQEEVETSRIVAGELRAMGLSVTENIGGHGVVAEIVGRSDGPAVALRADMDALPITETTDLPYASRHAGRMHACGHDGHTATLLAAASYLAATRDFPGRVVLIFQPAEERYGGAQPMLDDGLLARFPFDSIFSFHNWPGMETGTISVENGPVMAGSNEFEIVFGAVGAHGAMPHRSADPILAGGYFVTGLQQIVSRTVNPLDSAVVTVGSFQSGVAQNVIPTEARLRGTYRGFSSSMLDHIRIRLEKAVHAIGDMTGVSAEMALDGPDMVPVVNTPIEAETMRRVASAMGNDRLVHLPPSMAGDDFGVFLDHRPGAYAWIGNGVASPGLHQPDFDFNDDIIAVGAQLLAGTAETSLRGK